MRNYKILRLGLLIVFMCALWFALATAGHADSANAVWPEAPGKAVASDGKLTLDGSHMGQGYVMACVSPSKNGMKIRVTYSGNQLMYDINRNGDYEAFPLQLGSGKYTFELFENVKGSKYSAAGKITLTVKLKDENAAFLVPNQYVYYERDYQTVQKSDEIAGSLKSQSDIYNTVTDFIGREFSYDFVRASTISSGTLPEVDPCFAKRSGICQDLAAVMVCMLRVQGVPSKLCIGYADKYYHAWTEVVVNGETIFFDPTAAVNAISAKKYTTERVY